MRNPFYDFMRLDPPRVIGREQVVRELLEGVTEQHPHSFQIAGFRNLGATTLLRFIAHPEGALSEPHFARLLRPPFTKDNLLICYLDFTPFLPDHSLAPWLLEQLCLQPSFGALAQPVDVGNPVAVISQTLAEASRRYRVVLFFDHFDRALVQLRKEEATQLRPLIGLASIVTATETPLVELNEDATSSWFGGLLYPISLEALNFEEAAQLLREPLGSSNHDVSDYYPLLKLTGFYPYFILKGAAKWYELRGLYPRFDKGELLEIAKARLLKDFRSDFVRFWNHMTPGQRESLCQIVQTPGSPTGQHTRYLDNLMDRGLVVWEKRGYQPFSELWAEFIREKIEEQAVESDTVYAKNGGAYTPQEQALLDYLSQHPNDICHYEAILREVWHKEDLPENRHLLRQIVSRLRTKMQKVGLTKGEIFNHRNKGYELRR